MTKKNELLIALNPVNHYSRLPDNNQIKQFFQKLQKKSSLYEESRSQQCFLHVDNLKNAILFASLCFGGLACLQLLQDRGIGKDHIQYLRQEMNNFLWDESKKTSFIFEENSKKLGKIYPFYYQNIFTPLNQIKKQDPIFEISKKIIQTSKFLYGVKIRLVEKGQKTNNYKIYKKEYQSMQTMRVDGSIYLLFNENSNEVCNFGVIQYPDEKDSTKIPVQVSYNQKEYFKSMIQPKENKGGQFKKNKNPKQESKIQQKKPHDSESQRMITSTSEKQLKNLQYKENQKTLRCPPCQLI